MAQPNMILLHDWLLACHSLRCEVTRERVPLLMQPNLLRNLCFLPTKNKKYRTHFLIDIDHVSIAIHIVIVLSPSPRLYFLRQLRKFNLPQELLKQFYSAVIESVLCRSITVWFGSTTKSGIRRLQRTVRTADRIIGAPDIIIIIIHHQKY